MATTKLYPITATLKSTIEDICNPNKANKRILISSFNCCPKLAYLEFQFTQKYANGKDKDIAYHLIQSFSYEDNVTLELAHKIGIEFADKLLQERYEYVLATHLNKGYIHNHIIFNSVSVVDYTKVKLNEIWQLQKSILSQQL